MTIDRLTEARAAAIAACPHDDHRGPDGLPICKGDDCNGHTVACGQGLIVCPRHLDRYLELAEAEAGQDAYAEGHTRDEAHTAARMALYNAGRASRDTEVAATRKALTAAADALFAEQRRTAEMRNHVVDADREVAEARQATDQMAATLAELDAATDQMAATLAELDAARHELEEAHALAERQTGRIAALSGELANLRECMGAIVTDLREVHAKAPVRSDVAGTYRAVASMIQRGLAATDTPK